ncbi:MAG TPA: NAD-dependent epimerase/dehydratase family protein [Acidimicrobiales bacterium]
MSAHVVFGTGQVGGQVVRQLVAAGQEVAAVSRAGRLQFVGARNIAGDATDPEVTTAACIGADVVYFCLDAPDYGRWPEQFPPLQRGVLTAARRTGARLVVLENLYGYGPVHGQVLHEGLPMAATSVKARTRVAMTRELMEAHESGSVEVSIGRASDYFGPGVTHSALAELVVSAAVRGKTAQIMGDPDRLHTYSFTPDVAGGLITLGTDPRAVGSVWHLPVGETRTTREIVEQVYALAGTRPRMFAAGRTVLRLYGLLRPGMREYLHTLYQFTDDWQVSDARFRATFGDRSTPLDDALRATVEWSVANSRRPSRERTG